jgi:hypothetical protein
VNAFLTTWISDKHDGRAKKTRRQRGTHRLILPTIFCTRRQIKKAAMEIRRKRNARRFTLLAFETRRLLTKTAAMKVRCQRNARRLKLPALCTRSQREKLNLLKHVGMTVTSPRIPETCGEHVSAVLVAGAHVNLERIIIASCCLLISIFLIVIVVGRDY